MWGVVAQDGEHQGKSQGGLSQRVHSTGEPSAAETASGVGGQGREAAGGLFPRPMGLEGLVSSKG